MEAEEKEEIPVIKKTAGFSDEFSIFERNKMECLREIETKIFKTFLNLTPNLSIVRKAIPKGIQHLSLYCPYHAMYHEDYQEGE